MASRKFQNASLAIVLSLNFLGLTFQVRSGLGIPVRDGLVAAFSGGQNVLTGLGRAGWSWVRTVREAGRMRSDRDALAERVARLEWELTVHRGLLERARGFTAFDAEAFALGEPVPAEIIGASASPLDRTVTVNRGARHGIARDAAVMAADGLVGRVVAVGPTASQVELLPASTAAVAALTSASRTRGIVRAGRQDRDEVLLQLDYVPVGQRVEVGEQVISSGLDGIFPKGLPVGRVVRVVRGTGMLLAIGVEPAVDFDTLERVFLVPPLPDAGSETPS